MLSYLLDPLDCGLHLCKLSRRNQFQFEWPDCSDLDDTAKGGLRVAREPQVCFFTACVNEYAFFAVHNESTITIGAA